MVDKGRSGQIRFGLFVPDQTPEYLATHTKWCLALGAFLFQCAESEHLMRRLLIRYSGTSESVGRALFHTDRVADMKDTINRILDETERDAAKIDLQPFFSHLTLISGVRNNIVHWGGHQLETGDYLVSNAHLAPFEKMRGHRVSAADLEAMTDDLSTISGALVIMHERTRLTGLARFPVPPIAPAAWRYKPRPLPPLVRPRNPKISQGRVRLRAAYLATLKTPRAPRKKNPKG